MSAIGVSVFFVASKPAQPVWTFDSPVTAKPMIEYVYIAGDATGHGHIPYQAMRLKDFRIAPAWCGTAEVAYACMTHSGRLVPLHVRLSRDALRVPDDVYTIDRLCIASRNVIIIREISVDVPIRHIEVISSTCVLTGEHLADVREMRIGNPGAIDAIRRMRAVRRIGRTRERNRGYRHTRSRNRYRSRSARSRTSADTVRTRTPRDSWPRCGHAYTKSRTPACTRCSRFRRAMWNPTASNLRNSRGRCGRVFAACTP